MMRVVRLHQEVGDRELEVVGLHAARLVLGTEAEARSEVLQDGAGLRQRQRAVAQERRREERAAA